MLFKRTDYKSIPTKRGRLFVPRLRISLGRDIASIYWKAVMYCDIFEETCIGFQVPDYKQWIEGKKGVDLCKGLTQIDDGQRWSFFIKINVTK